MTHAETVVITGASAGVGRATARCFARDGARIALLARESAGLQAAADEVRSLGGTPLCVPVDVADAARMETAAGRIEAELGLIDIWINCAMATIFAPVHAIGAEEFRRATEVTYLGTVYGSMAALRRMRARNRGVIVQVGSALAYRAIPLQAPYCGAKFAIRGFTDALRVELMHERSAVHVTMVQLSAFNTPQFDWGRCRLPRQPQPVPPIFQPEVAARAIHWAAHHRRREWRIGFPAVKAIVGNKLAPGLADRLLARKGYRGQMDEQALPAPRPGNLFQAWAGDYGAHGRFDRRASDHSMQSWLSRHRDSLMLTALLVTGLAVLARASRRLAQR